MTTPTRLFDILPFQQQKFDVSTLLACKHDGEWKTYSTKETLDICNRFSAGMLSLGIGGNFNNVEESHKVAIISNNRPEWMFTDLACQQIGVVLCPVYPTTHVNELQFIFNDANIQYVFVSSEDLLEKVNSLAGKVPSVKGTFSFDKIAGTKHWSELLDAATPELLEKVSAIKDGIQPNDLATIIYTSGTTGTPKGVMLSHQNIVSNVINSIISFPFEDAPGKRVLSFLPLNHIFERMVTYMYFYSGLSIYYAESLETIGENLKELKPHGFTTVPRLLEKVYEKIIEKGNEQPPLIKRLFFWAVKLGLKYDNAKSGGVLYNMQLSLANKIVFSKWREGLGGNIEFIITGGAACQERLMRIFNAGGIPIYEGYGPTENSPVITVNRREPDGQRFGTVGPPIVGQEVALAEDGEIMVKGPSVMLGYYKRPDLTADTMRDGWLLTGDIGVWVEDRFLKITDRKKELFKTSGGKYVAPQPIENKLKESPFIEQVIVLGAEKKFVSALIVPGFSALKEWLTSQGISYTTNEDIVKNQLVRDHIKTIVENFNPHFNHVEQVRKFELLPNEWSINTGEMTPKMSLKRKVIMEKYKDEVENLYNSPRE